VEANCHFLEFPALRRGRSAAANPSSNPIVGAPEEPAGRREGYGGRVELSSEIARDRLSRIRRASTLVLFSIGQMWYLHAIARHSRRTQNSRCVDPVRFSLFFGFIGSLQHSVHTRRCSFGDRLQVVRKRMITADRASTAAYEVASPHGHYSLSM
jgi:hypothetical protein